MYSSSLIILALAVFGAFAQTLVSSGCGLNGLSGLSGLNSGFIGGVSSISGGLIGTSAPSASYLESVPIRLPSILHPTSVQESCNCIKTIVRPQIRKEVFTIPSVQRFLQTTSTPIVETVPFVTGSAIDVPTVAGIESGVIGCGASGLGAGVTSRLGFGGVTGIVNPAFAATC